MRMSGRARRFRTVLTIALIGGATLPAAAHAAPFTVNSLGDTGGTCPTPTTCTLRQAINSANALPGPDTIGFSAFGTITPGSALPPITESVTIDGRDNGVAAIQLDGTTPGIFEGLLFSGAGNTSTVRGFAVVNFDAAGIDVRTGANVTIQACRLGLGLNDAPGGNGFDGVNVNADAGGATIGGTSAGERNVISANAGDGIFVAGSAPAVAIHGNFIGTNSAGTAAVGSQPNGVVLQGSGDVVGGSGAGQGNVIAGHTASGVFIASPGANGNSVEGNVIGLAADGTTTLANATGVFFGDTTSGNRVGGSAPGQGNVIAGNTTNVAVSGDSSRVEGNVIGINQGGVASGGVIGVSVSDTADGTIIGGTSDGARNVLSGNSAGIQTNGPHTRVLGNYIGLAADGLALASNTTSGVIVQTGADDSEIGGPGAGEGNLISGNNAAGVVIRNSPSGVLVRGNGIGINKNGEARGNGTAGVRIFDAAGNTIGGPNPADANTIAFNGTPGVDIDRNDPTDPNFEEPVGNQVLRNSIHDNGGLGIDLSIGQVFGRTANDPGDGDTGPNNLQNFPVLASAVDGGGSTAVSGTLNSTPGAAYTLRFWSNPTGDNEAETYLGEQAITTDAAGNAPFTFTAAPAIALGRNVTATATDAAGNTSEISDPVAVLPPPATPGSGTGSTPPPTGSTPPPTGSTPPPTADPHAGILGFRATTFRARGSFITFRVTNRADFDFVIRATGREGELRSARAPAFTSVRATVKAGETRTIRLRVPSAQRKAIARVLKRRSRVVRRPSIRITNLTTRVSRQYKPRIVVKR